MAVSFKEKLKTLIKLAGNPAELSALLSMKHSGFLQEIGWFNSFDKKASIGKESEPLPWVTYSFIKFITDRLKKDFTLFEFGSGNSTLFYSRYVGKVVAIEHSEEWYEKISALVPESAQLHFIPENENYEEGIDRIGGAYDIIIVDAIRRNECIQAALAHINDSSVIILDDSDRSEYSTAVGLLEKNNYRRIDFWGISPGYFNLKCTTVFYKSGNCLGI